MIDQLIIIVTIIFILIVCIITRMCSIPSLTTIEFMTNGINYHNLNKDRKMSTIEEALAKTKNMLRKQAMDAIDDALDVLYTEYLPHAENDTASNVYHETSSWVERFFAGTLQEDDIKIDITNNSCYNARNARQKIYEENKEEIQAAIGKDLQQKIDSMIASRYHDSGYSPYTGATFSGTLTAC